MGTPQHTFVAETGQPPQRRRKARLACNPCRARKTGCDGRKPVCSACSLRGWDDKCGYPDSVMQPSAALTLVELDRRLQRLENDARTDPNVPRKASPNAAPSVGSSSGLGISVGENNKEHQALVEHFGSDQPAATRNMAYMRQGLEVAGPRHPHDPATRSESPESGAESPTFPTLAGFAMQTLEQPLDEIDPHALVLPPRHFADELLRWYWLNFHSVFPFLHWPMFKARYHATWKEKVASSPTFDDLLFYATLNMVFATACLRNEIIALHERYYYGDEFYKRSLRLMSAETIDAASIPIVQLLLLRGVYLYFAGRADRCWLMSGAAIRVAVGLGLHTTPKRQVSQLEREMRRRVWFGGCVTLDQYGARSESSWRVV
ncbi:fungal-specific transcription factor domain-containing protein [Chaetomium sp. MPI-CAGE-AT-0009]|nr:fungal-specific transcription factor domain-containing protein [Chaetomium sp. MPI-CAGE-AT-0009]